MSVHVHVCVEVYLWVYMHALRQGPIKCAKTLEIHSAVLCPGNFEDSHIHTYTYRFTAKGIERILDRATLSETCIYTYAYIHAPISTESFMPKT
jgi:hypothetical protein